MDDIKKEINNLNNENLIMIENKINNLIVIINNILNESKEATNGI